MQDSDWDDFEVRVDDAKSELLEGNNVKFAHSVLTFDDLCTAVHEDPRFDAALLEIAEVAPDSALHKIMQERAEQAARDYADDEAEHEAAKEDERAKYFRELDMENDR